MQERFITPVGEANFPYLNKPDTKFDSNGVYRVNLRLEDNEEFQKMISKLESILDGFEKEVRKEGKKVLGRMPLFEPEEDGSDYVTMKFKRKAVIIPKNGGDPIDVKIAIFDKYNRPLKDEVGRGSLVKVCFEASPYHMASTKMVGLTLRIVAVQVKELKMRDNYDDGSSFGFDSEEDEDVPFDAPEEDPINF